IPVGALPAISTEIAARHPRFARMLASAETVATQAFQLWLTRSPEELGWIHGQNSVAGARLESLNAWCDMSYLLAHEGWRPGEGVRGLAYFCGVLDDRRGEACAQADRRGEGRGGAPPVGAPGGGGRAAGPARARARAVG